jgi:hypothetical protein
MRMMRLRVDDRGVATRARNELSKFHRSNVQGTVILVSRCFFRIYSPPFDLRYTSYAQFCAPQTSLFPINVHLKCLYAISYRHLLCPLIRPREFSFVDCLSHAFPSPAQLSSRRRKPVRRYRRHSFAVLLVQGCPEHSWCILIDLWSRCGYL